MIPLRLREVAAAAQGSLTPEADPQALVEGPVVVDSRQVAPGGLFVAVAGERVDGHDFAAAAVAAGATAVLASRPVGVPAVLVPDPVAALGLLARAVLDRLPELTVVGLTGSSGKTSTKDLLAAVLPDLGETVAPVGSFNNEVGLPLTALGCRAQTRFLVAEMGARGLGHIAYLTGITPPRVGLVLNVGSAHAGEFGSRQVTAQAKGELVEALPADGVAVLNADDPLVSAMAERTRARVLLFGQSPAAQVRAEDIRLDPMARASFTLCTPQGRAAVRLGLHGEHQVSNALAAAAAAFAVGADVQQVARSLSAARPASRWRMEVTERPDGVTVINDAYNANPESVRAALKALAAMGRSGAQGPRRTWAVLGSMLELGASSVAEHDAVGRLAVRLNISRLVAVGDEARPVHNGAAHEGSWGEESAWVPDAAAALDLVGPQLAPGDVVLVKASRSIGLEQVAAALSGPAPEQEAAR